MLLAVCAACFVAIQPKAEPVFVLTAANDPAKLDDLLRDHPDQLGKRLFGRPPLHYAIIQNQLPVVKTMLAKGADIEGRDQVGNTPLHIAVICNRQPIITLLLASGAQSGALNHYGQTPLDMAPLGGLEAGGIAELRGKVRGAQ
ncbi:MAG: ankyrin repeat domain-containing protein [Desulfarculaceae bacterium]|nr:ankyrin repeat domain-containing protein [Desulfarculaceae bacterium]MCF8072932.1 ankyrin repeat domain-containing protein [Desulfarculaceae bacterium]MCF8101100.1 ankyrin repeat domain-containing protein [Desulfarculaceae bacterium]MCF8115513.1 ankyrin repeat domain-containing protein [Desulfarculaceae bacterium]